MKFNLFIILLLFGGKSLAFLMVFLHLRMQFSVQFSLSEEDYYSGDDADFDTEEEKEELSATELDIVPEFQTKDLGKTQLIEIIPNDFSFHSSSGSH